MGADGVASNAGKVIIANSYYNFFLMQKSTSREMIRKSGLYPMSDYENLVFDGVSPTDGEFGEVYVITDKFRVKSRIVLNKFLQTMLFTNSADRTILNRYVASGMTRLEAIRQLEFEKSQRK